MSAVRYLVSAALLLMLGALVACSYQTEFVVVNGSGSPATVTWWVVRPQAAVSRVPCPLTTRDFGPAAGEIVTARIFGPRFQRRGQLPGLTVDAAACRATAQLEPGAVMSLWREVNFVSSNAADRMGLDRLRIEIQGANQSLAVEPGQAFQRFVRRSDQLYALTYR